MSNERLDVNGSEWRVEFTPLTGKPAWFHLVIAQNVADALGYAFIRNSEQPWAAGTIWYIEVYQRVHTLKAPGTWEGATRRWELRRKLVNPNHEEMYDGHS